MFFFNSQRLCLVSVFVFEDIGQRTGMEELEVILKRSLDYSGWDTEWIPRQWIPTAEGGNADELE